LSLQPAAAVVAMVTAGLEVSQYDPVWCTGMSEQLQKVYWHFKVYLILVQKFILVC